MRSILLISAVSAIALASLVSAQTLSEDAGTLSEGRQGRTLSQEQTPGAGPSVVRRVRRKKMLRRRKPVNKVVPKPVQGFPLQEDPQSATVNTVQSSVELNTPAPIVRGQSADAGPVRRKLKRKIKKTKVIPELKHLNKPHLVAPPTPYRNTPPVMSKEEHAKNRTEEEKRFLSLFTIVSFQNDPCTSGSGNNGTCYSSSDCSRLGGSASGSCASGFGVCCLFTKTCGDSTSNNCTYFQNTGYPSTYDSVGSCQLTINKANNNVCQLRLDFDNMILAQPEATDHVCQDDQFIVSGGSPIPAICGTNTGIHMYVDMGLSSNSPVVLTAVTSGASFSRSFSVKVTQIECTSLNRASDGCLQFFTGVSGQINSFNYNSGSGLQLSNTDYSVCVRMERNFCGIQYTACPDNVNTPAMSFSITGGNPAAGSVVGTTCTTDWITIPCATNSNSPTQTGTPAVCVDRICGMVFNSATTAAGSPNVPVNSFMKPFVLNVHTDALEGTSTPAETANRGFCLNFVQQPCTSGSG